MHIRRVHNSSGYNNRLTKTYADDDLVHEAVDVRPFELGPAAVHHEFGVSAREQHEPVAPGAVTQHAASQQDLLVVQ